MNCIFTRFTHQLHIILVVAMSIALSHPIVAQTPSCTCKTICAGVYRKQWNCRSDSFHDTCFEVLWWWRYGYSDDYELTGPKILGSPNVTCLAMLAKPCMLKFQMQVTLAGLPSN